MKELSIEQKAKAYDEALERMKSWARGEHPECFTEAQKAAEFVFPELKESEDERIRKSLICHLKECRNNTRSEVMLGEYAKWLAWLEKQVEQNNNEDSNILQRFSFYSYKDEPNILYLSGLYVNEEWRNKGIGTKIIEVANEVAKSLNCNAIRLKTKKNSNAERLYRTHGYNSLQIEERDEIWLEKQGKQNPKFRVGDIIKCKYDNRQFTIKSVDLDKGIYTYTREGCGNDIDYADEEFELVEPKFKIEKGKWYVCIKNLLDNYANKAFRKGDIYLSTQDGSLIPSNSNVPYKVVCPDMYFRDWTIQDAKDGDVLSYRDGQWIFIYKEKIDNNSFSYYTLYSTIHQDLTIDDSAFTLLGDAITPATKEQSDTLMKAIADAGYTFDFEKKELKKIENKPAWSEDDEPYLDHVITAIKSYYTDDKGCENPFREELLRWLESLRSKNRWKPSEEQLKSLQKVIDVGYFTSYPYSLETLYEQLKQL